MGPGYAASAWVLLILTTAYFGSLANGPVSTTLLALGHVRLCAAMTAVQSFATLALSVALVLLTDWGIYGVAIGTVLPMIVTDNVWLFIAGYGKVGGHPLAAARATALRWAVGAILFADPLPVDLTRDSARRMASVLAEGRIVSFLYVPIGVFIVLRKEEGLHFLTQAALAVAWTAKSLANVCRRRGGYLAAEAGPERDRIGGGRADTLLP